ncbi:FIST signal transduction protein [Candidatus Entotheonella palauensis]|uniref:FIST signal transduction protein n=1 Tax=Candidatus Entotheonella palauensis TaxID=93172 RepID=UPI000B7F8740|nr:FIST N-terminal domain-containing protein [Candidatus Entotheonella palauensis]
MQFASAISREDQLEAAIEETLGILAQQAPELSADIALVFSTPHHLKALSEQLPELQKRLDAPILIGCTGGGVIGDRQEIERRSAFSILAASMPGVSVTPFHIEQSSLDDLSDDYWQSRFDFDNDDEPAFVLLPDPFTIDAQKLLDSLNTTYPLRPVVGGLASGTQSASSCALFFNGEIVHGAVGLGLTGNFNLHTVVSQGCRPIGDPQIITRCDDQIIYELGGRPALEVILALIETLSPADQRLARSALLMGRVIDEYKDKFERGDFLIRTFMGADKQSGAIAVGDVFRPGQTVQLHVRDAATAREDLHALMHNVSHLLEAQTASGALLFPCNGRGAHLYGEPDHDSRVVAETTGPVPMAGFFCNGEIGPIGNTNFLHGFTASIGIFQEKTSAD